MKSACEYLIKIPEGTDKKEMFDEIDSIAKRIGNCIVLNFESVLKKDISKFNYKAGDEFFVVVGEVHSTFATVVQTGMEFTLANHIAEEMGLPVTDFSSVFDDKVLEFDDLEKDFDM